jgi:hypothetical protein
MFNFDKLKKYNMGSSDWIIFGYVFLFWIILKNLS